MAEALALVEKSGERSSEAELYRLTGDLLLRQAGPAAQQAETCFRQATEVARHQRAKFLELRAAMSLSRLWQKQGKRDEARRMLAEIYGWFTEGFDTRDLQEARALLEELSRNAVGPPPRSPPRWTWAFGWRRRTHCCGRSRLRCWTGQPSPGGRRSFCPSAGA